MDNKKEKIEQFPSQNFDPNMNYVSSRKFSDIQGNVYTAQDPREHKFFTPVPEYKDFFGERKNYFFPEFGFDIDTFENLCADFCTEEDFPIILNCTIAQLDKFCMLVYRQDFHNTYNRLSIIAKQAMKRCYRNLAKSGNATAINTQNMYVNFNKDNNSGQPIQIVLDINKLKGDN